MSNARVWAVGFWFVAWASVQACGGGSDDEGAAPSTAPPPAAEATGSTCAAASCPTLTLFGNSAPGCCQTSNACGGSIVYMGTPFCAPPDIEMVAAQIAAPFEQLEEETIVTADECPGMMFQGATIAGCCDQTGVCGVSTESFASGNGDNALPFDIPVTCISEAEARALGMAPAGTSAPASTPIACGAGN